MCHWPFWLKYKPIFCPSLLLPLVCMYLITPPLRLGNDIVPVCTSRTLGTFKMGDSAPGTVEGKATGKATAPRIDKNLKTICHQTRVNERFQEYMADQGFTSMVRIAVIAQTPEMANQNLWNPFKASKFAGTEGEAPTVAD